MSQRPSGYNQPPELRHDHEGLRTVEHYEGLVASSGTEEVEQIGFFPLELPPEGVNAVRPASRSSFRASDTTQGSRSDESSSKSNSAGSPQSAHFRSPNGAPVASGPHPRLSAVAAALKLPPYPLLPDDILTDDERAKCALPAMTAEEANEGAILYRMKSIQRTKEGGYYQRFAARVAREGGLRRPTDPQTPVPQTKCSRKQWDQVFLAWRQSLKTMADTNET